MRIIRNVINKNKNKNKNINNDITTSELIFWGFLLCVLIGFLWYLIYKFFRNDGDTFWGFLKFNLKFELAYRAARGIMSSVF